MTDALTPFFDGHNDILYWLGEKGDADGGVRRFLNGDDDSHLDLPRARAAGLKGGLFAVYIESPHPDDDDVDSMEAAAYDMPLPPILELEYAQKRAVVMIDLLHNIVAKSNGAVCVCRSAADIRDSISNNVFAAVLHFEGAEPIDRDLKMLETYYEKGLRSLGPVWSRPTLFAHGVPFRFPGHPDTGEGLTDAGVALIKACNEMKIAIDLSHLNEKGFWDVARISKAPLIASHSNPHVLCRHSRNLTDRQLDAIKESGGLVGVNFITCFLREDGRLLEAKIEDIIRHADYLIDRLGVDGVGLGSDFGSAIVPSDLKNVSGLPRLAAAFTRAGYDEITLRKICCDNWINVLERTWGH
ncbi:MAG: dipeptidase [Pseudomonadota bacterium]